MYSFIKYLFGIYHVTVLGVKDSKGNKTEIISLLELAVEWEQTTVQQGTTGVLNIMKGKCRLPHKHVN